MNHEPRKLLAGPRVNSKRQHAPVRQKSGEKGRPAEKVQHSSDAKNDGDLLIEPEQKGVIEPRLAAAMDAMLTEPVKEPADDVLTTRVEWVRIAGAGGTGRIEERLGCIPDAMKIGTERRERDDKDGQDDGQSVDPCDAPDRVDRVSEKHLIAATTNARDGFPADEGDNCGPEHNKQEGSSAGDDCPGERKDSKSREAANRAPRNGDSGRDIRADTTAQPFGSDDDQDE